MEGLIKKVFHPLHAVFIMVLLYMLPVPGFCTVPKPGDVIDSSNIDQYKEYLPTILNGYIKDGWGMIDPPAIHIKERTNVGVPKNYMEASRINIKTVTLKPDKTVDGLVSGLPFPEVKEPDRAWKIMWNHYYRWRSDGYSYSDGYWYTQQRQGGSIVHSKAQVDMLFFSHRTAVDPKPLLPNGYNLFSAQLLNTLTPPSKDMATLTWRYDDPFKDDDMWTYVPTLRRTLRLVSSERANPVRGSSYTWDDLYGFDGKLSQWVPKLIGEQKMLALMDQKTKCAPGTKFEKGYRHPVVSGPTDPYEIREFYILDVFPASDRHPEEKKTLFIEKEVYNVMYSHVYDKQRNLWKGTINCVMNFQTAQDQPAWSVFSSSITDLKNNFWSQVLIGTVLLDSQMVQERFTPSALGSNF